MRVTSREHCKMKFQRLQLRMEKEKETSNNSLLRKRRKKKVRKDLKRFYYVVGCIKLEAIGYMRGIISVSMNINSQKLTICLAKLKLNLEIM